MKKIIAAALVALAVPAAMAAATPAAAQSVRYSGRYFPADAILEWDGARFTIIRIDSLDEYTTERANLVSWVASNPDQIEALQATIRENRRFAAALRQRSVQLNNVVAITRALNGNLVVYLR